MGEDTKEPKLSGRDGSGKFTSGNPGGPGGRRKMDPFVHEMLKAATPRAAKTLIDALDAERPVVVGRGRDAPDEIEMVADYELRVKAANAILDRMYGKPAQEIIGAEGGPVTVAVDLASLLGRLVK